ncbi:MAG: homoserine O-acetyltransferase [Sinobacteraceae bacterium]|nr:homoserine O-acetyltransferase [Nevskiaceae bacterium]MCP5339750.1 homoserine O-acetyltransferase [Nevskiaceae bacterium]MCP5467534.1 homoserine O-acetyltransferase [Nevskiaceae bacterium]MCP5471269.1 homoserine O-acetyltransferase [Nevskiaceae bacterium]
MSAERWSDAVSGGDASTTSRGGDARRYAPLPEPFVFERGGELRGGVVAYETWGRLNAGRDNAILLFTGLSPSAHAAASPEDRSEGWWERMLGPGKAIDTERFFVVCVNSLGSPFGSSSPTTIDPATGEPWRLRFPELSVGDIATGGYWVLRHLGLERVAAVIGPSLGGMVVLAFVARHPGVARGLVCISGSAAASPVAIALRAVQREAILRDPQWQGGQYAVDSPPRTGMRLARKLGTITYRSTAEWTERFGRQRIAQEGEQSLVPMRGTNAFAPEFQIEGYLEAQAEKFVRAFDANCYLYLSRAMDRFELAADAAGRVPLLARAGLESALVIGVESDFLFAIDEQAALAAALQAAGVATCFTRLDSREGHDAFLVDIAGFDPPIRRFLAAL